MHGEAAVMPAPEAVPVVGNAWIEWIRARENCAEKRPVLPGGHEVGAFGVLQDVGGDLGEGVVGALRFAENVIVRLTLEREGRREKRVPVAAKPGGGETLVARVVEAQPE